MANIKNNASSKVTRQKLIEAAGRVFAERGLHAATIKQITELAGVNIAAVNYHFSDKYELYAAVIRHAVQETPFIPPERGDGSPRERLRTFITRAIQDVHDPDRPTWRSTLLSHELNQPTAAMDAVMDEMIWPRARLLHALVRDLLGPDASGNDVAYAAFSIIGQLSHYAYSGGLLRRIHPELAVPENAASLADHIADFSLRGLLGMRHDRRKRRQPRDGARQRRRGASTQATRDGARSRARAGRRPRQGTSVVGDRKV